METLLITIGLVLLALFGAVPGAAQATAIPSAEVRAALGNGMAWNMKLDLVNPANEFHEWTILRNDRNFAAFLGVRVLSQFGGMAFAFYVIYAVRVFGMSDASAAVLVAFLLIGQVVLSPLMGRLGDRWSHRSATLGRFFCDPR